MRNPLSLAFKAVILLILIGQILIPKGAYSAIFLDKVVATVNGELITWSELMSVVEVEGAKSLEGLEGKEREAKSGEIAKYLLNSMIDVKLQLMEAKKLGFDVSDNELESAIADIKTRYNLSSEALITSLKLEGFTLEEYKKRLSEQILLSKISNYRVKNNILITDAEIKEYYNSGEGSAEVRIRQIFFSMPESDEQKAALNKRAEEVMQRIKAGENFASLAIEFSEDASKEFGGDLGFIGHGTILNEVEDVAFSLKTGEVSAPFWSPAGLHIVKVEETRVGGASKESEENVKDIIFQRKYNMMYDQWIKMLRENAYIEVNL
ncbi:MAG: peptidylprolyl isomerase [Thermodesulfovibrionia bacterium]|nr:peptidylprolyl isomerase [Thermodesulfovibrionia bacterium]